MPLDDKCKERISDSQVRVGEGKRRAVFKNSVRHTYIKIRVDGCLDIKEGPRADWVVSKLSVGHVIIEFKGSDISHAVKQIVATTKLVNSYERRDSERIGALIVGKNYPQYNTLVQRSKDDYVKQFRAPLSVINNQYIGEFEDLLAANNEPRPESKLKSRRPKVRRTK